MLSGAGDKRGVSVFIPGALMFWAQPLSSVPFRFIGGWGRARTQTVKSSLFRLLEI